jgi:hypothetical protein
MVRADSPEQPVEPCSTDMEISFVRFRPPNGG